MEIANSGLAVSSHFGLYFPPFPIVFLIFFFTVFFEAILHHHPHTHLLPPTHPSYISPLQLHVLLFGVIFVLAMTQIGTSSEHKADREMPALGNGEGMAVSHGPSRPLKSDS